MGVRLHCKKRFSLNLTFRPSGVFHNELPHTNTYVYYPIQKNQCQVVLIFVKFVILVIFCSKIISMKEDEIVKSAGAKVLKSGESAADYVLSTDTRSIKAGEIYLPLKGANFDGEKFIQDALKKGAAGYFTTGDEVFDGASVVFKVENTLEAYLKLAGYYREKINPKVIGITGSSGKTTAKEMMYSVVSQKYRTVKTFSNHNNEIGFCQTVFEMAPETEVLIVEMGMRGPGEIELISRYARPDIAVITNAGTSHIGRLGSVENIAKAKCEIALHLNPNGTFIALDQDRIKNNVNFSGEKVYFSLKNVEITEKNQSYTRFIYDDEEYELSVAGDYNVEDALAVIETAKRLNIGYENIKAGLRAYKPIEKRWEALSVAGFKLINDSYNANPDSMKASVKTFVELYEKPVVVLGNMGELGENEIELHKEVGKFLAELKNIKNVKFLTVGNLAAEIGKELEKSGIPVKSFGTNEEVSRYILANPDIGNTIFLKASRTMKFEEIIENLKRGAL